MLTPLIQKGISNLYCENQLSNTPNASNAYNASGMHNVYLIKYAKRAKPQENNIIKNTLYAKVQIISTQNIKFRITCLQQKKQVAKSQLKKNASKKIVQHVLKNSIIAK